MTYQVIARKYRPQTFDAVIGQAPIVQTLQNAITENQLAHAYIFSGMRGVGKTTTARILAKAVNCVKGPTVAPCGKCDPCREIAEGRAVDVIEVDAASNRGIDEIRELRENVRYLPARDPYKVFIIDEAHMLTPEAFNALLKTLEEPPPRVLFVLATTEPQKLPTTIRSRCQSFHFRSIGFSEVLGVLERVAREEKVRVQPEALAVMTRAAEGSLRDALSILDQAIAYSGGEVTAEQVRELLGVVSHEALDRLMGAVAERSPEQVLRLVDELVREGHNLQHFCREALRHVRNLLVVRIAGAESELAEAVGPERERLAAAAEPFLEEDLLRFFQTLLRAEGELRWSPQPRLHLELELLKMVEAERLASLEELLAELGGNQAPAEAASAGRVSAKANPAPSGVAPRTPTQIVPPTPSAAAPSSSLTAQQIQRIKAAVYARSKFLGSFVEQVADWQFENSELVLWFSPENRTLAQMLDSKQQETLGLILSEVLVQKARVRVKLSKSAAPPAVPNLEERARNHPVVQALYQRLGGRIRVEDLSGGVAPGRPEGEE
ncbi:MAG: DNA polymerase III subunit gamma/tau [Acidobacteria bacterium]|nr:DNA polymerase III subunit gamma/tau [Acidobacteriota bacterium]